MNEHSLLAFITHWCSDGYNTQTLKRIREELTTNIPIFLFGEYRYNRYIVISCYVSTDREPYLFIQVSLYLEVQGIVNKNGTTANLRLSFNESLKKKNGEKMLFL